MDDGAYRNSQDTSFEDDTDAPETVLARSLFEGSCVRELRWDAIGRLMLFQSNRVEAQLQCSGPTQVVVDIGPQSTV